MSKKVNSMVGRGIGKIRRAQKRPGPCVTFKFDQKMERFRDTSGKVVSKSRVFGS